MRTLPLALCFVAIAGCSDDERSPALQTLTTDDASTPDASPEAGPEAAAEAGADAEDTRFAALTAAIEAERKQLGAPGVAVAVLEKGKVTYARGFGVKHPEQTDPVLPTTLFRIGSTTKMMTTAALLQLVGTHDVDLDKPVTDYVPEFHFDKDATWAPSIHVSHLLTHATGMYDLTEIEWPDNGDQVPFSFLTGDEFSKGMYLMAPAGSFYNYSNPNFMLAGLVAERMMNTSYRELMRTRVFEPLGMKRTMFVGDEVLKDGDYATGKTVDWSGETANAALAGPSDYDCAWGRPAGFAWSSVNDMLAFADFLLHGNDSVLGDAQRVAMQSKQIDTQEYLDLVWYGYGLQGINGFFLGSSFYPLGLVGHSGAIPGFSAEIETVPERDFAIVFLANTDGAYFQNSLATALKTLIDLPAPVTAPDPGVDPADFALYAGEYLDPYNAGPMTVTTDGTDVIVSLPALDQAKIKYEPKLQCYVKHNCLFTFYQGGTVQLPVTFLFDEQGKVEFIRSRLMVFHPVKETGDAAPPPPPPPSSANLQAALRAARMQPPPAARWFVR